MSLMNKHCCIVCTYLTQMEYCYIGETVTLHSTTPKTESPRLMLQSFKIKYFLGINIYKRSIPDCLIDQNQTNYF